MSVYTHSAPVSRRVVRAAAAAAIESLERRQLLAAHYLPDQAAFNALDGAMPDGTVTVNPGDSLLFATGGHFTGTVRVEAGGVTGAQAYIGTYDPATGVADAYPAEDPATPARTYDRDSDTAPAHTPATLHVPAGSSANAIHVQDVGNVIVRNLVLDGTTAGIAPTAHNSVAASGIFVSNANGPATQLDYVRIDDVEIRGFANRGILFDDTPEGSDDGRKTGYANVRITDAKVHGNVIAGIEVLGDFSSTATTYAHRDFYIGYSEVHDNTGRESYAPKHTGSGIVISDVQGATIERSVAHHNGAKNDHSGGPVGIWAWDVDSVAIRQNESYSNKTDAGADGGGFDLDGGVTNSVMEYNYSHDNDGAGYGIYQFGGARAFHHNVVRYNISVNDGRKGSYGAIDFWNGNGANGISDIDVYNNTVYVTPSTTTQTTTNRKGQTVTTTVKLGDPRALRFISGTTNVSIRNNIFQTTGGVMLAHIDARQTNLRIEGNDWWSSGSAFSLKTFAKVYTSVSAWSSGTGYERIGTTVVGKSVDPRLVGPVLVDNPNVVGGKSAPTVGIVNIGVMATKLGAFKLSEGSTLRNAGLNLWSRFGISAGPRDFFGNPLPEGDAATSHAFDIGAHEFIVS